MGPFRRHQVKIIFNGNVQAKGMGGHLLIIVLLTMYFRPLDVCPTHDHFSSLF